MIIYGIKNCDKVRAALKQAQAEGIAVSLHDFRVDGIDLKLVTAMLKHIELEKLVNKRSTTWKQLTETEKQAVDSKLLVKYPTLIKRPVIFDQASFRIGL